MEWKVLFKMSQLDSVFCPEQFLPISLLQHSTAGLAVVVDAEVYWNLDGPLHAPVQHGSKPSSPRES
jgi:hypothetical protein